MQARDCPSSRETPSWGPEEGTWISFPWGAFPWVRGQKATLTLTLTLALSLTLTLALHTLTLSVHTKHRAQGGPRLFQPHCHSHKHLRQNVCRSLACAWGPAGRFSALVLPPTSCRTAPQTLSHLCSVTHTWRQSGAFSPLQNVCKGAGLRRRNHCLDHGWICGPEYGEIPQNWISSSSLCSMQSHLCQKVTKFPSRCWACLSYRERNTTTVQ